LAAFKITVSGAGAAKRIAGKVDDTVIIIDIQADGAVAVACIDSYCPGIR
jgi:hypothetical protein